MKVSVRLFGQLRSCHPGPDRSRPLEVELPAGASVSALGPALRLPQGLLRAAFVNNQACDLEHPLSPGDQVGLFPPVVGG